MKLNIFKLYKRLLWLGLIILLVFVLDRLIIPLGVVEYSWIPGQPSEVFSQLKPIERVNFPFDNSQTLKGTPVYLLARTSRPFTSVQATVEFEANGNNVLELGVLKDKLAWRYEIKPLYNQILNNLLNNKQWQKITEANLVLLQKKGNYKSINDFLKKPPKAESIAVYNYTWKQALRIDNYQASSSPRTINSGLVGSWTAYTYIKNEVLRLRLQAQGVGELQIWNVENKLLNSYKSQNGRLDVDVEKLPEGLYRLEWKATRDVLITELSTYQSKFSFAGQLTVIKPTKAWCVGSWLTYYTEDPKSLGGVLSETYKSYKTTLSGVTPVNALGNLTWGTDGRCSFWLDALVGPQIKTLTALSATQVDYILANYQPTSTAEFNLSDAYREDGKYNLMFVMPEFSAGQGIKIKKITLKFKGVGLNSIWSKLKK